VNRINDPAWETQMNHIGAVSQSWDAARGNLSDPSAARQYELRYRPLFDRGCGFAFPCDANGKVDLDDLSEQALRNYLYARAVTGSQLCWPSVERLT
jgi:hypothetical protein